MIDYKTFLEFGLVLGMLGTLLIALPAFKSKFRHLPNFNPDRIDVNSTRSGLILIGLGFLSQFIAIVIQP